MLLEMIAIGSLAYYATRRFVQVEVKLKPHAVAEALEQAKTTAHNAIEQVRKQTVSKAEWEESQAKQRAQDMYDKTVADIFESATEEEKSSLLELFKRYAPKDQ